MKYCTHCGAEMDDEADFCVRCGKRAEGPNFTENGPRVKYCTHCGAELKEGADVCLSCGRRVEDPSRIPPQAQNGTNALATVAKVFMILTCAGCGISALLCLIVGASLSVGGGYGDAVAYTKSGVIVMAICNLIPLAWTIPLTVHVFRATKAHTPISTATKVCILIFVNVIPGILLLCMKEPVAPPRADDVPPQSGSENL